MNKTRNHPLSVKNKIVKSIKNYKRGKIFFPKDFIELGSTNAINNVLNKLENDGFLIRLAHGIYLYPKNDNILGILFPSMDEIAKAIAKRDKAKIIPTGINALNKLGLSTQIPMNIVYLTDGSPRDIQIENRKIKFKKTTPKNLAVKGEISGLVIQALKEIGQKNITEEIIQKIESILSKEKVDLVKHDAKLAPAWIAKIFFSTLNKRLDK
ncbi:DUF6088 family protein [Algibacter sp. 2305UL17-15]|uniref:DUF6088 family protein n=1 Tax=Algibacter sp. 2305UL17-15 TaxID=3231268 RepID=UPI003457466B